MSVTAVRLFRLSEEEAEQKTNNGDVSVKTSYARLLCIASLYNKT